MDPFHPAPDFFPSSPAANPVDSLSSESSALFAPTNLENFRVSPATQKSVAPIPGTPIPGTPIPGTPIPGTPKQVDSSIPEGGTSTIGGESRSRRGRKRRQIRPRTERHQTENQRSREQQIDGRKFRYDASITKAVGFQESIESAESVELYHTAPKNRLGLNTDYTVQAFRTGMPLMVTDVVTTATVMLSVGAIVNFWQGHAFNSGLWLQLPVWIMLQTVVMWLHQLYPGAGVAAVGEMRGTVRSAFVACAALSAINLVFGQLPRIEFGIFALTAVGVSATLPMARRIARGWLAKTSWWGIRTLLIGSSQSGRRWCELMQPRRESGLRVIGYVCSLQEIESGQSNSGSETECSRTSDANLLGADFQAYEIARQHHAPVAAFASPDASHLARRLMFQFPSLMWLDSSAAMMETANPIGAFNRRLNVPFLRMTPRLVKRCLDLAICIPMLAILFVPLFALAVAIKLISPGPIFYGSPRVGQNGRRFKMWKFRSMVPDAGSVLEAHLAEDADAKAEWDRDQKLKNDPRIIPGIGRIMRSCSLDELPQLWNVLVGEMSLVGPRPLPPNEIVKYRTHYYQYSQMWPGITGLWQVSGRNDTSFEMRVFLVHHYAANWSLWLDAWILLKTPLTVITRKGAY